MYKSNISFILLLATVFALIYYVSVLEGREIEPFDESPLREEIRLLDSTSTHWQEEAVIWQNIANIAEDKSDSLEKFKPSIKYYYEKKYTFNTNADILQLDSVIRTNW
jgi:hypothetical protein